MNQELGLGRADYFVHWYVSYLEERDNLVKPGFTSLTDCSRKRKKKHLLFLYFLSEFSCTFFFQSELLSNSAMSLDRCATDKIMGAILNYNEAMMLRPNDSETTAATAFGVTQRNYQRK